MKKFLAGLVVGLVVATFSISAANENISLIVDGEKINPDVPPQIIDGRTMVPARFIAEPLGAEVEWDDENNSVVITSKQSNQSESNIDKYYFKGRIIVDVVGEKYANVNLGVNGVLSFNNDTIQLPTKEYENFVYFSIEPLIEKDLFELEDFY